MASYIVALTGASGVFYGLRLIEELLKRGDDVELIVSPSGFLLLNEEAAIKCDEKTISAALKAYFKKRGLRIKGTLTVHGHGDVASRLASGSSLKKNMVVCPCSMGTLARIAAGISGNLIERAADCVIKEGGRLVLVPRETPLSPIHLENMLKLSRAGVIILPAMPAFYHGPEKIGDLVDFIAGKILDSLCIENNLYKRWAGKR